MPRRAGKPAGPAKWDVLQIDELDASQAIDAVREAAAGMAEKLAAIGEETPATEALAVTDAHRLRAALRSAGQGRDLVAHWTRVLAEAALREGVSQRDVAAELGVATSTINRWAREPVGWNWSDVDD